MRNMLIDSIEAMGVSYMELVTSEPELSQEQKDAALEPVTLAIMGDFYAGLAQGETDEEEKLNPELNPDVRSHEAFVLGARVRRLQETFAGQQPRRAA